jgi:hypothetical protein
MVKSSVLSWQDRLSACALLSLSVLIMTAGVGDVGLGTIITISAPRRPLASTSRVSVCLVALQALWMVRALRPRLDRP